LFDLRVFDGTSIVVLFHAKENNKKLPHD